MELASSNITFSEYMGGVLLCCRASARPGPRAFRGEVRSDARACVSAGPRAPRQGVDAWGGGQTCEGHILPSSERARGGGHRARGAEPRVADRASRGARARLGAREVRP